MVEVYLKYPKSQKNVFSVPFLADEKDEFVLWFFTGSKCNLECTHCYVESSPRANKHPYLRFETFKEKLVEATARNYKKLEIYFTGGEPFMNPELLDMIEESLKYGNTTILTNATRFTKKRANQLREIQNRSKHILTFRVSFDGPDERSNDIIRGKKAFVRANSGLRYLVNEGFNPIVTAMRSWPSSAEEELKVDFKNLLKQNGIPADKQRLKILPPLRIGRESIRDRPYNNEELFTKQCFVNYDYNNLQCSNCRMVSENGVWVCPILINEDDARMGDTLEEAARFFPMTYMACWTCRMEGMNCGN